MLLFFNSLTTSGWVTILTLESPFKPSSNEKRVEEIALHASTHRRLVQVCVILEFRSIRVDPEPVQRLPQCFESPVRTKYQLQYQGSPDQRSNKIRIDSDVNGQQRQQKSMYNRNMAWTEGKNLPYGHY
jgi:hypothetical protein